jgi:hypothetical protein
VDENSWVPYVFAILFAGMIVILVVSSVVEWVKQKPQRRARREEEKRLEDMRQEILKRGVQNISEWLFLFPQACTRCGCREWVTWTQERRGRSDLTGHPDMPYLDTGRYCSECRHGTHPGPELHGNSEPSFVTETVQSPFLTAEQHMVLPDRAYRATSSPHFERNASPS